MSKPLLLHMMAPSVEKPVLYLQPHHSACRPELTRSLPWLQSLSQVTLCADPTCLLIGVLVSPYRVLIMYVLVCVPLLACQLCEHRNCSSHGLGALVPGTRKAFRKYLLTKKWQKGTSPDMQSNIHKP